jgi:hypothetical protein
VMAATPGVKGSTWVAMRVQFTVTWIEASA